MKLIDFINRQRNRYDIVGILCNDFLRDKNFPASGSEKEQISYMRNKILWFPHLETGVNQMLSEFGQYSKN